MNTTKNQYIKTTGLILALSALIVCAVVFQKHYLEVLDWINKLGWIAPILFLVLYTLASLMFLPTMVLTLAGGALFGPVLGTLLNLLGATFGAAFSFLITRHLVKGRFAKQIGARLNKFIAGVDQKGWMFVAFLRLFPIVPFNIVNYGLGVTGIKFRLYLIITFIFLIPTEIIYTYFGYAGRDALSNPDHFYRNGGIILTGLALLLVVFMKFFKPRKNN